VLSADVDVVFRKDMEGLWEEMLQQTRRIRADAGPRLPRVDIPQAKMGSVPDFQAAAFAGAFSKVIFEPR